MRKEQIMTLHNENQVQSTWHGFASSDNMILHTSIH